MMDSHGNPGIAGNVIGVETATVLDVLEVEGVLTTVVVTTLVLTEELTTVIVTGVDEVELAEVVVTEPLEATLVVDVTIAVVLDDAAVVAVTPPGGSRWNIIPSDAGKIRESFIGVPTANPLVLDRRNMPLSLPVSVDGMGGLIAIVVQAVPS
jgi:hypothetical protein